MKRIYCFIFFLLPLSLFAQKKVSTENLTPDARLIEAFGADYIERLQTQQPFMIQRWNYYLDHAYYIADESDEKAGDYPMVEIENLETLNILKLEKEQTISRDWNLPKAYRIGKTGKLLVYLPGKTFNQKLKEHLGQ